MEAMAKRQGFGRVFLAKRKLIEKASTTKVRERLYLNLKFQIKHTSSKSAEPSITATIPTRNYST